MNHASKTTTLGILASILAAFFFTGMDVGAKAVGYLGTGELTFVRGIVGLAFLPFLAWRTREPVFSGKDFWILQLRGFMGGLGILLFFYCLKGVTLGDASILAQLAAFFMCLLSPLFLKTTPSGNIRPWLAMITVGAALVLQVWNFSSFNGYALIGMVSAFCSACAYTCIGKLTERGGHSGIELVFYFQFYSMLGGLFLMVSDTATMPQGEEWFWLLVLSVSALMAQLSFTWACTHIHPVTVNFVMYTGILFHVILGWCLWGEALSLFSWIGGALIVLGSGMLLKSSEK